MRSGGPGSPGGSEPKGTGPGEPDRSDAGRRPAARDEGERISPLGLPPPPTVADAAVPRRLAGPFPWSVAFIAVALLALAAVPIWWGERINAVDAEIKNTLEPARNLAADLATTHARQMSRFQEYLLTGSNEARQRYSALMAVERQQLASLQGLLEEMDLRVRQLAVAVGSSATEWQLAHRAALETPEGREAFLETLGADLVRYEQVLQASAQLRDVLNREVELGEARMEEFRRRQGALTVLLILTALVATVVVARLARGLAGAAEEATLRRVDAVQARREIDAVLEATAEAVLGLDLEGRVIRLNQAGARLLGFSQEDARGRPVGEVLFAGGRGGEPDEGEAGTAEEESSATGEGFDEMRDRLLAAVGHGEAVDGRDGVVVARRGGRVDVRWSLRPLVDGTRVSGAVLTLTDMREVREAERALRKAMEAREETMAVVGHDLRSPLGSIAAAAELLMDVPLPEDRRRLQLESIQSAADRMNRLIGDLLDLARIDAGGLHVNAEPTAPGPLLAEAVQVEAPKARQRNVELVRNWPGDLPLVQADAHRIQQVLGNLISNALRYTPTGGRVEVGARPVARGEGAGDGVEIWVRDSGSGIDPEDLPRLWDPFWQPDRDRAARRDGAGLGLAIVKGIVEAHGGRVRVESAPGSGSRFSFSLPGIARPASVPAAPPRSS